ncbi:MAG TPA: SBBP repeat-containing protein, partial [Pyrinomonadaceae bacterium]|nr:SBBP repeat-containing protein [Pyrinomonadaceae bacterium]
GALAYSTFLGGLGRAPGSTNGDAEPDDTGFGIAVNASGEAYVTGRTESERFPSTAGAAQGSYNGGLADAFVTRLDASGSSLLYSTFLGGSNEEDRSAGAVALDPSGNVYLTGTTSSTNFPTLNPVTAAYSGSVESDAYATKLTPAGAFVYSTYLGTNNFRRGFGVAADAEGSAYVVGSNALRKLDAAGALVIPSRTLGGEGRGVALDADGNVYVGGITTTTSAAKCTSATQFCPTSGAFRQNPAGGANDGFVLKFEGEEDEVEIAGFTFPRAALADDAFQTKVGIDASAQFCSRVDYAGTTIAQRVKSALTDGCPATSTLGDAEFEADFVDNRVVNLPGADLAVFEIGSGNGNEPFSVSAFNNGQFTSAVTYTPQPTVYFDCANLRINVALIDLDDFGVAPGAYVTRLRFDNLFVPNVVSSGADIADIAAVHSAPPNRAPVADAGPDQTFTAAPGLVLATLDGSHSSDPDGDALAYDWRNDANQIVSQDAAFTDFVHPGVNTYTLKVTDPYGLSSTDTVTVTVNPPDDTVAPVTVAVPSTPANGAGWHNADLSVALQATDNAGGSGVKQITYSAAGAQAIPTTTVGGDSVNIPFSAEGTTTVTFFAEDNAGNVEQAKTFVVRLDKTAPAVVCGSPDGQWHGSDVSIQCTASDGGSGLANSSDASFALTTSVPTGAEDANASTGSRQVCDAVGHCVTAGPVAGNKVDRKAPDINLVSPAQGASYTVGQPAAASYNCSDGGSGVVACVGPAANGGAIDTSAVGAKSFTVTAADAVGNVSTKTVTYFVGYGVCALYDQTKAHKSGSTVPVKLNLCGANGENLSAAGLTVTALGTVRLSDFAPGEVEDSGQANPDDNFRFTTLDGSGGYVFNLQTKGLTTGTYVLVFKAGSDPSTHGVQFQIK